ncbi:MAG: hypothetical protein JSR68_13760 [Proteobacteria bacterium]|nr:hypothetical protein [Pseudomonadota bacterium]
MKQTWNPNDWLRLVALVGAFALFGLGAWMLFQGVVAEGSVDLKSTVLSGTIKASSAGLYICFFALFIIIFVLVSLLGGKKEAGEARPRGRFSRLFPLFWALLAALVVCAGAIAVLPEGSRSGFAMAVGVLAPTVASVVVVLLRIVNEDDA